MDHFRESRNLEQPTHSVLEKGDKINAELTTGLFQAQKCVPSVFTLIAAGTTGDFTLGNGRSRIGLTAIIMQRSVWSIENSEELVFVLMGLCQPFVQRRARGGLTKYSVESPA
jgi:hypothetical protein